MVIRIILVILILIAFITFLFDYKRIQKDYLLLKENYEKLLLSLSSMSEDVDVVEGEVVEEVVDDENV